MDVNVTEAFILNTKDYGESDRLITFYTRARGKLKGIAKGARRSKKRFANTFEPCSLVELGYRERRSLVWIEACKLVEPHLALRTELDRWGYGALVSEIVMEMAPEGDPHPELFSLMKATLAQLCEDRDPLNVVLLFAFRFLDLMGYLPVLESCSVCQLPLKAATRWLWQMDQGVLTCPEHPLGPESCIALDLGTLALIQHSRLLPLDRLWRLRLVQERKIPLLYGLADWIRGQIRKDLKSFKLLEQVQSA
jgi:DNA repair protein RecO (recombination protein O)